MSGPTIAGLRAFVAVVDHQGFSAAARAMSMAQSTLSAHVRALEAALGTHLVDRNTPTFRLTAEGQAVIGYAKTTVDGYDDAVDAVRRLGHQPVQGTLAIGGTSTAAESLLPHLLAAFSRRHPEVVIDLIIANTAEIRRRLDTGEIRAAVIAGTITDATLEQVLIAEEPQIVISAADHPLVDTRVGPKELRGSTILLREPGSTTRTYQEGLLEEWRIPAVRTWTIGGTSAIVEAVAAGLGLACVTQVAADAALRLGRVGALALEPSPPSRPVHLYRRRGRRLSQAEHEFMTIVEESEQTI
jgi:LysR family transcriptional regulator, transcriptional activator of the cysJI operon